MTTLVWLRDDLRIADHPALAAAAEDPAGVVVAYVLDEESPGARPLGGAAKWWLHHSLAALGDRLAEFGVPLVLRRGPAAREIPALAAESGAARVLWNRRYGAERAGDAALKLTLREKGIAAHSFTGGVLFEPGSVVTAQGTGYRVYSAFWRACLSNSPPAAPIPAPATLIPASVQPRSDALGAWGLLPTTPDWAGGLAARWTPGEAAGEAQLERFLGERARRYAAERDFPDAGSGSELSPYLRWGELSPRTVWHRALAAGVDAGMFLSELGWREFAWHTAFASPDLHERGLNPQFDAFPWEREPGAELLAWQRGETGFPLVDAGMRELWETGFMHNRARMVTASFLTKNLLIDWRLGEAWFWDTLVDADAASNPFNWQWVAGCGADAAPYFRIFNPLTQQQRFDPSGEYVSRWAPESLLLPELVDLRSSRARALAAYDQARGVAPVGSERER
ncbi:cryptochrome/photolyase family protein [Leucobacter chromiireducens]|uniref:Deoxyribodipyrimidine photo-lyase n=1 Tax=Leucobacter chromiireducens subsp. chromiireducens TaxID=660067 RepID=A0ABS1SM07_9MICO|nr:deoxyribodipyrimidine photo-lyase [Leucobacter chromiireducens]MBL3688975.1 deoxyribodipyrimidine photo-lyase [Leucobacter chromiireducens subsp. chromiireducens]